jgi:hypothetical protein
MCRRAGFTRIELLVVIGILLVCSGLIGFTPPIQMFGLLLIGWVLHLVRIARETVIDGNATLTAATALACFVGGLHWLALRWRQRSGAVWPWRWTLSITGLMLCLAVAGIAAVGVAHQSVWLASAPKLVESGSVRYAAARMQSMNNLKQIGLAAHEIHQRTKVLPPGATFDADGRPLHSWTTPLLPYIEQDRVYKMIDLNRPWSDPHNHAAFKQDIPIFLNPSVSESKHGEFGPCHYAANVHLLGATARRLDDITDGAANTLLYGEAASRFKPWGQPLNWRDPSLGINRSPEGFGNPQLPGAVFVFADGSARFLRETISPEVLKALATPAGAETVEPRDWE